MKAATFYSVDDIRIEDQPVPEIGPGEALVRIRMCGICSGEVTDWYMARKAPIVPGHETVGVVEAVGEGVNSFEPGDRVFIHHHVPCGECRHCERGDFSQCDTWRERHIIPGGMAEFAKVTETGLKNDTLRLPDSMSWDDASLIEPVACSVRAMKRAEVRPGDFVVVIGLGSMGVLNLILARHCGAEMIIAADLVPYRLEKGKELGADHVVDVSKESLAEKVKEATHGRMADVVIVGPGSIPAMESGLECVGRRGTLLLFTPSAPKETLQIEPFSLYFDEIDIRCSYSCGPPDTREAMKLIADGVFSAESLVTHRFPLEKVQEAFNVVAAAGESIKILVVMDE